MAAIYRREGLPGLRRRMRRMAAEALEPAAATGSDGFDRNDYVEWVRRYDTLDVHACDALRLAAHGLGSRPVISVLMPTYNPRPDWLVEAIESVRAQAYPWWELCIADDASPDPRVREVLEHYAQLEPRIRVAFRPVNGHISAASNSALELVTGEWIALLDHDDLLPAHALFCIAQAINDKPDLRLIYSDEDRIGHDGKRFGAYFKSDWNPELFLSQNLFSHLGAYRADLVRELGGFRQGLEGSQDYDLALRAVEKVRSDQIHHIPRVLYHWRIHPQSTASSMDAKPYVVTAAERALNEHLQRRGLRAHASGVEFSSYRVRYELPQPAPLVTIVIHEAGAPGALQRCIASILRQTTYPNYEILVACRNGNAGCEQSEADDASRRVRVLTGADGVSLRQMALRQAQGEVVALLHGELEVLTPNWLEELVGIALRPEIGAVGARLWYADGTLRHAGLILGIGGVAASSHHKLPRDFAGYVGRAAVTQAVSAVSSDCMVLRRAVCDEIGSHPWLEEAGEFADVDFCLRLMALGYRNVWTPHAQLRHGGAIPPGTHRSVVTPAAAACAGYMRETWAALLACDPAYNPNLTLEFADFSLAWPPRLKPLSVLQEEAAP
jgi:glycosyltransferase involved in cell wall biosynthesis